jgi:hypothetical protein
MYRLAVRFSERGGCGPVAINGPRRTQSRRNFLCVTTRDEVATK